MAVPRVFHSKIRILDPWGIRYRTSEPTEWVATWSEAVDKALTWARVSHVSADETKRLIRQEATVERIIARGEAS